MAHSGARHMKQFAVDGTFVFVFVSSCQGYGSDSIDLTVNDMVRLVVGEK